MRYSSRENRLPNLVVKNANIRFSNFAGKEGKFNKEGERSFTLKFEDTDFVQQLRNDGWNIRVRPPKEGYEDDGDQYLLDVKVSYNDKAPHPEVEIITRKGSTFIGEDEIGMLDVADVDRTDVVIAPYFYSFNGREGISAYLRKIRVWLAEDGLDDGPGPAPVDDEPLPFD